MLYRLVSTTNPSTIIGNSKIEGGITYIQDINPYDEFCIGSATAAEVSFNYYNDSYDADTLLNQSFTVQIQQDNDAAWRSLGVFTVYSVEIGKRTAQIKLYDNIKKFDKYVDSWIDGLTFPITLANMFSSLCTYCDTTAVAYTGINYNFSIKDNFTGTNITGRQVLQYLAQAAAGYAVATTSGTIQISHYASSGKMLDNTKYKSYEQASTNINPITKLIVKTTNDDVGIISGTGTNIYIIDNNPLFYADTAAEVQTQVDNIYNSIRSIWYVPGTVYLLQDWGINCGDIIVINGNVFFVMRKEITNSQTSLQCVGKINRETQQDNVNSAIVALRGKTNELTRDLDATVSRLTTAEGDISTLEQTATSITARVENAEGDITTLEATTAGLTVEVAGKVGDDEVISSINQSAEAITINANKLNLTGYITATDVGATGTTSIDGARITTGTIDADRLRLQGNVYRTSGSGSGSENSNFMIGINTNSRLQVGSAATSPGYTSTSIYGGGNIYLMADSSDTTVEQADVTINTNGLRIDSITTGDTSTYNVLVCGSGGQVYKCSKTIADIGSGGTAKFG